ANGVLGISEKIGGDFALLGREEVEQLLGRAGRQFLEQGGAVVGRDFVEDLRDLFGAERLDDPLLVFQRKMFENFSRQFVRQNAQQYSFVIGIQVGENLRHVRGRKPAKDLAQLGKIAFRDQFREFRPK